MTKKVALFGATGTIGDNALDIIARFPEHFSVSTLTAYQNSEKLCKLAQRFQPERVVIADKSAYKQLRDDLPSTIDILAGEEGLIEAASAPCDVFVSAIVGFAALRLTMEAIKAGRVIALANKECLVAAGAQIMEAVATHGATLLPVDSEHNALFQCWHNVQDNQLRSVTLTASGGPFRGWDKAALQQVTVEQAVAHPNWTMGAKISVDSASLMNKGLELIEARYLFDLAPELLQVLVHPESLMHCMIGFEDGSHIAQLAVPDMRTPLAHAMHYPQRLTLDIPMLDLAQMGVLHFEQPDKERFPCLQLAYDAMRAGQEAEIIVNAANEIAVDAFLRRRIGFMDIPRVISTLLEQAEGASPATLDDIYEIDHTIREKARQLVATL